MQWREPEQVSVPEEIARQVGGHPLIAMHLLRSGVTTPEAIRRFLDPDAYLPDSPFELPDMEIAVERLHKAIGEGERILIWGDFDVDGQTASALLFTALRGMGADVRYHIPLRDGEGHGMHLPRLRRWLDEDIGLIITCDTGITAHEAVDTAAAAGVDVLITDHHLPGGTLPRARAVINPMRLPAGHRMREMPGVGVACELIRAATGELNEDLLDLVALGIVADVAEQKNQTRWMLQRGLRTMRRGTRSGLLALFGTAQLDQSDLTETDVAFGLAPRLNAQGRLGDASACVELLSTDDPARAAELAWQLEGINARRKLESRLIEESARSLIDRDPSLLEYAAIVLSHSEWSGGIVGIVANRLAESLHKPVIMLCEKDDLAFGSARSVIGCNITDALTSCRDMLLKFGGHAMAAGLALRRDSIHEFRRRISRAVREMAPETAVEPTLGIDGYLNLKEITIDLCRDFRRLAPFGNGNPPLTLATRDLRLARGKRIGRRGDHYEMTVEDELGNRQRVMWWGRGDDPLPEGRFDLAYTLRIDKFRDRNEPVLELIDFRIIDAHQTEISSDEREFSFEDLSGIQDKTVRLGKLIEEYPDAVVWREDDASVEGVTRSGLEKADTLIVWTVPPGPEEWEAALTTVEPERIFLFGQQPEEPRLESFLQRLGGMLKFVISSRGGVTGIDELAAATAQRPSTIRYALLWFQQTGRLHVGIDKDGGVTIAPRPQPSAPPAAPSLEALIRNSLGETAAWRRNFGARRPRAPLS
ncbi:MAG: single-stranded-DNA-specific exonuclease RecJ [Blastocatellales bacterium]